jgi:hypothetical protein
LNDSVTGKAGGIFAFAGRLTDIVVLQ